MTINVYRLTKDELETIIGKIERVKDVAPRDYKILCGLPNMVAYQEQRTYDGKYLPTICELIGKDKNRMYQIWSYCISQSIGGYVIASGGKEATASDISESCHITKQTLTRAMHHLGDIGLIRGYKDRLDERITHYRISPIYWQSFECSRVIDGIDWILFSRRLSAVCS